MEQNKSNKRAIGISATGLKSSTKPPIPKVMAGWRLWCVTRRSFGVVILVIKLLNVN